MTVVPGAPRAQYSPKVEPPQTAVPPALPRRSGRDNADAGVLARQVRELHALLRRRLLISASVMVGFFGVLPLRSALRMFEPSVPEGARTVLIIQWVVAAVILVLGLVIWKRPPVRLRHLRTLEALMFGTTIAYLIIANGYYVERFDVVTPPIGPILHPIIGAAATRLDPVTLRWLVLIVGYGTLIPNTWKRCATVTFFMVGLFLTETAAQALMHGVQPTELAPLLLYPTVWMTVGSVIAIFGSYRVSLLERRVQEIERLGQYRLQRHLGAGGMGDVYLAEHVLLKQPFALKLLSPDRISDPKTIQRFEREVQAMARLEHWNTVEIYDYGHGVDGSFYYVMEYLPGLTLDQMVTRHGPLPASRAIHFLRQICGALQEAHTMGLMHRDVKPGNIIICERAGIHDVAKLLDFGLVKHVGISGDTQLTLEGTVAGTPAYMSPEQAAGSEHLDARSDIYSLGAVAYFLLTGRAPFTNKSATQLMAAHMYEEPTPLWAYRSDLEPALSKIVQKCLSKKASDRFQDAQSLADALGECEACGKWSTRDAEQWWIEHPVRS